MYRLSQLVGRMPQMPQPKLTAPGVGVWLVWQGQLSTIVGQVFTEFGGFEQVQEGNQSLWYFMGDEVVRAIGRLLGYARVNKLPLFVQMFPADLQVGYRFERTFACAEEYLAQDVDPPQELEVYVHPQFHSMVEPLPGMSIKPAPARPGLAGAGYGLMSADIALAQDSPLGWYYMMRPLGDPLDKHSAEGWRTVFSELQALLERMAMKYLSHEGYLILSVENARAFRNITRELLQLESNLRTAEGGNKYWPCVMACVLKKGIHLNKDLPKRINLDWKELSTDYPHMSYRSALYLGPGFQVNDVRRSSSTLGIDDWCSISLVAEQGEEQPQGQVPFKLPSNLLSGSIAPCYYCGLTNHRPSECPTKTFEDFDPDVWEQLGMVDMAKLDEASLRVNKDASQPGAKWLAGLLAGGDERGLILRAMFEIGAIYQLRVVHRIWRSSGKTLPAGLDTLNASTDGVYLWDALSLLRAGNMEAFETEITANLAQYGRGFQPRSIQGFAAMEQGDWDRAGYFWQEAARNGYTPLQLGWLQLLEGRAMEVQGDVQQAMAFYKQARSECSRWQEPVYRHAVCMVKLGFADKAMSDFLDLVYNSPNMFNRILLDPELERGRIHILSALWGVWSDAKQARDEKLDAVAGLPDYLKSWFKEDHPFLTKALVRAERIGEMAKINNYVCFIRVVNEYDKLQVDLRKAVEKGISGLGKTLAVIHDELKAIHVEAAWFPFSKLLREFNADFNACATKLNWMRTTSLQVAANFRKCQDYVDEIDAAVNLLRARLVTLRIVRDSTLFMLILGKSFMWMELVGLLLSLVIIPGVIFAANKMGQAWLADMIYNQKWQIQKGVVIIVSILAMALAAVRTALTFEKKRAALFKESEEAVAKANSTRSAPMTPKMTKALPAGAAQPPATKPPKK